MSDKPDFSETIAKVHAARDRIRREHAERQPTASTSPTPIMANLSDPRSALVQQETTSQSSSRKRTQSEVDSDGEDGEPESKRPHTAEQLTAVPSPSEAGSTPLPGPSRTLGHGIRGGLDATHLEINQRSLNPPTSVPSASASFANPFAPPRGLRHNAQQQHTGYRATNPSSLRNVQNVQNAQGAQNVQSVQNIQNIQNVQNLQNVQQRPASCNANPRPPLLGAQGRPFTYGGRNSARVTRRNGLMAVGSLPNKEEHFYPGQIIWAPHHATALDPLADPATDENFVQSKVATISSKYRMMVVMWVYKESLIALPLTSHGSRGLTIKDADLLREHFCLYEEHDPHFENQSPEHLALRVQCLFNNQALGQNSSLRVTNVFNVNLLEDIKKAGYLAENSTKRLLDYWNHSKRQATEKSWTYAPQR